MPPPVVHGVIVALKCTRCRPREQLFVVISAHLPLAEFLYKSQCLPLERFQLQFAATLLNMSYQVQALIPLPSSSRDTGASHHAPKLYPCAAARHLHAARVAESQTRPFSPSPGAVHLPSQSIIPVVP